MELGGRSGEVSQRIHIPTLTAVLPSSSDARLPPCLLLILKRLVLRGVRMTALMGRGGAPVGDPGGETVISLPNIPKRTTPGGIEIKGNRSVNR